MNGVKRAAAGAALASAILAGALVLERFRRDMKAIAAQLDDDARTALTDFGPIEYGRSGCGAPALVIHGAGGGFDQGLMLGQEMLGDGFDVIAPSRFGYLGTAVAGDGSPAAQADAHAALLDALEIERAIVIGISAGAPSAIEYALRHSARTGALILVVPRAWAPDAPPAQAPFESRRILAAVEQGSDFAFWCAARLARRAIVRFLGVPPALEAEAAPEERARVSFVIRGLLPLSKRMAGIANDGAASIGPWPLERITAPTLIVSTADDLYGTLPLARHTAAQIAGAELVALDSGGHLLVGRGAEVRARIAHFLKTAA